MAGIDTQWQADLADLSKLSKSNDKHRYLLCIIDVFSKYAWVVPIKDKTGKRTLKTRMWKYFTHHRTLRYVDILPKLVHGYNHAYHRSIKCARGL